MLANLMKVAGVDHVITIDLHATQMQGFFKCPVDNLRAEPLIAKWVRLNIPDWQEAVVVSKNPGGTKRVTSLADALQLSFGVVTTDRRRPHPPSSMYNSAIFEAIGTDGTNDAEALEDEVLLAESFAPGRATREQDFATQNYRMVGEAQQQTPGRQRAVTTMSASFRARLMMNGTESPSSPLANSTRADSVDLSDDDASPQNRLGRVPTAPGITQPPRDDDGYEDSEGEDADDGVCTISTITYELSTNHSAECSRCNHRSTHTWPHRR